ncbi:Ff.00g109890.m01.CDS01 [Fusarium sp. VM40]|nr:Ff.00g109890.m01.CDS01 [Fusarium sp. VM40]
MTLYFTSNKSVEVIDPLKQAGQLPPYTIQTENTEYYQTEQQDRDAFTSSKPTVGQRFHKMSSKAGSPLNKAAHFVGAEGWWPSTMDKECSKAARILHSFTSLSSSTSPSAKGPLHPTGLTRKSLVKIPPPVLQRAAGLAIFNVLRAGGCHGSLSGGSGIVLARRPDGTWSPPSSFVVSTLGAGFVFGLDLYDCVCVLNTPEQVTAFTKPRLSLGAGGSVAIGPVGTGASVDTALSKTVQPVWSYMKSRGLWIGIQIDGTIVVTRGDANATFYNERGITAEKILHGDVAWPLGAKPLFEVLQALEGRTDYNRMTVQAVGEAPPVDDSTLFEKESYSDEHKIQGSEKQGGYTDERLVQESRQQPMPEGATHDTKEELAEYEVVNTEDRKDKDEKILDEKARLAASGY